MNREIILQEVARHVKERMAGAESGHDFWHVVRVRNIALDIGKEEGADLFIVELAALVHDIADWKFHGGDETIGPRIAREILESVHLPEEHITHICEIIATLSYKGAGVATPMQTLEGKIVQDADRLDSLGAIGIARAFNYGGYRHRPLYDPKIPPLLHATREEYKNHVGTTINHFYEKLLLLKDRMNTKTARRIAEDRHAFLQHYLDRFVKEWNGEA